MKLTGRQAQRLVDKWRKRIIPDERWEVEARVLLSPADANHGFSESTAYCECDEYFQAKIYFCPWNVEDLDHANEAACHEVCHIVFFHLSCSIDQALGPTQTALASALTENAVETFARALVALERGRR